VIEAPAHAFWIGSDHAFDLAEAYLNFKRDVTFDKVPNAAILTITADSRYKLWLNGSYVHRGPARCWPHAQQIDEINIAPFLRAGINAVAVQVYSPGYSHFAYVHRGATGLLAWLECDGTVAMVTDQTWHVQRDPSWDPLVPRLSIYGSGVERRDLRAAQDWHTDTLTSPSWRTPRVVSPAQGPIWSGLSRRDVPMLIEEERPLFNLWQFRKGQSQLDTNEPHQSLRKAFQDTQTSDVPSMPVRVGKDETAIWVFDLGSSRIGIGGVQINGAAGGETLLISYAEKLRGGALVLSDPDSYCRMRPTDAFTLREGQQTAESFSQRGGRYLIFALHSSKPSTLTLSFFARLTRYPLAEKPLNIADPALAKIASLCGTTVLNCLQDGFVDSVWRESSQWLGDCVTEAFALAAISDDPRPLRRAITMAAQGAYPDGILPSVLPGEVHAYTITDYNFSWIELLKLYADHPNASDGDALLAQMLPVMDKMLSRFRGDLDDGGLLKSQPGRRLFLDWSGVDRREPNLTYNCRYLYALQLAATLADDAGAKSHADLWRSQASAMASALSQTFRNKMGWFENKFGTPASQLGVSLLILTEVVCGDEAQVLADAIVARSLDLDDDATVGKLILASPFMHLYVFLALQKLSRNEAILDIIHARWGCWAEANEATTWENWNTDFPDGSRCHGFSAHPLGWVARLVPT
jgi:hypothetical protein